MKLLSSRCLSRCRSKAGNSTEDRLHHLNAHGTLADIRNSRIPSTLWPDRESGGIAATPHALTPYDSHSRYMRKARPSPSSYPKSANFAGPGLAPERKPEKRRAERRRRKDGGVSPGKTPFRRSQRGCSKVLWLGERKSGASPATGPAHRAGAGERRVGLTSLQSPKPDVNRTTSAQAMGTAMVIVAVFPAASRALTKIL